MLIWRTLILSGLFFFTCSSAFSQFDKISYSLGLSSMRILGDNPNTSVIVQPGGEDFTGIGGSFNNSMPGFGARVEFQLDEKAFFTLPVGFDYIFFEANERIPVGRITHYYEHTAGLLSGLIGIKYFIAKAPFANVRAYAEAGVRISMFMDGSMKARVSNNLTGEESVNTYTTKSSALRAGGALNLGLEGSLMGNWYIDANLGLGVLNLIGRDDSRGELFTPTQFFENEESLVSTFNFIFMIKYKLK